MARNLTQDGQDYQEDPEAALRSRVMNQVSADVPDATPNPVYDEPPTPAPPPVPFDRPVTPWTEQNPFDNQPAPSPAPPKQGVTDPVVRDVPAPTPAAAPAPVNQNPIFSPTTNIVPGQDIPLANPAQPAPAPIPGASYAPIQGFDTAKLNDPTKLDAKYTGAVRAFSAYLGTGAPIGRGNLGGAVTFAQSHGFPQARVIGDDKIDFGDGNGPIDVVQSNGSIWFQNGQDRFGGAPAPAGAAPAAPTSQMGAPAIAPPGPTSLAPSSATASGQPQQQGLWNSDFVNQLRTLLMSRLSAASAPVDQNDPSITAPLTAARDEASRASDKERTALAENLYANGGLNTDAISQKIQQSGEKNAQGLSTLRATLITRELASRRDELKSLLQMAVQSGDAESARAIQMQLGELDATVRREGLGVDLAKYQGYLNALASEQVMN